MKTIMFIMAMLGFTLSGYAQKIVYKCPMTKTAHKAHRSNKTALVTHKAKRTANYIWAIDINCGPEPANCSNLLVNTDTSFAGYMDLESTLIPKFGDLVVTSSAFNNNNPMPPKYTCQGQQVSPPLDVANIPSGTQSLAVVMFDPKATPTKSTTFWLMWNIEDAKIPENFVNDNSSFNHESMQYGYTAVCPVGGEHNYHFMVYALDTKLKLDRKKTDRAILTSAMRGHVLAKGELIGTYDRHLD